MKKKPKSNFARAATKGQIFPPKYASTLLIPFRNIFLSPRELVKRLKLEKNHNVLELGPGPGYFSASIARALPKGKLVLADIQKEMLEIAKTRMDKKHVDNIEYYLCNGIDFEFKDGQFHRIYMVTVLGEVENKQSYIKEFERLLKSQGIISISEQAGDPDKMSIDEIKDLFKGTKFTLDKVYGTKNNFTINFRRK